MTTRCVMGCIDEQAGVDPKSQNPVLAGSVSPVACCSSSHKIESGAAEIQLAARKPLESPQLITGTCKPPPCDCTSVCVCVLVCLKLRRNLREFWLPHRRQPVPSQRWFGSDPSSPPLRSQTPAGCPTPGAAS